MKMTRKEAAHVLECGAWWDHLPDDMSDADMNPLQDALDVALAALHCDWVDAEKQPPTEEGSYLVCTKNGAVTTARYYSPCAIRPAEWQGNRLSATSRGAAKSTGTASREVWRATMFLSRNRNSMGWSIGGTPARTVSMSGWKTATPRITRTTALLAVNLWERRTE